MAEGKQEGRNKEAGSKQKRKLKNKAKLLFKSRYTCPNGCGAVVEF